ncbi:hypothetical protein [Streptomyces sp. NPDC005525]|uniref:hypothetical protein n=1 Tax=Streptomyces sp. NPDC005525 TaxID=3364720 RepID=UPI00368E47DF
MLLTGAVCAGTARVLSLLPDAGWSWAALVVGWLAGAWVRGALVGVLALVGSRCPAAWRRALLAGVAAFGVRDA